MLRDTWTMRRILVCVAVATALGSPLSCAKANPSKAAFCRQLRRTPVLEDILSGVATGDPAAVRRQVGAAATQFGALERAAPREIRAEVGEVATLMEKVLEAVDASPDDPQALAERLRKLATTNTGAAGAALEVAGYARDKCNVDLNGPSLRPTGDRPPTSTPGAITPGSPTTR